MHVSDWFPTIMDMAGLSFTPAMGHELDGVSQASAIFGTASESPRDHILYNIYYNVDKENFDIFKNAAAGVRKGNYKLLHAYKGNEQAEWYNFSTPLSDDYDMESGSCEQMLALRGGFMKWLFDLSKDPNETTNLYSDKSLASVKAELYELLYYYLARTVHDVAPEDSSELAEPYWQDNGKYIMPWNMEFEQREGRTVPSRCTPTNSIFSMSQRTK